MAEQFDYTYYGARCHAEELIAFLEHTVDTNLALEERGRKRTPVCIWGRHGIGKTEIVEQLAKRRGYPFAYVAPAQFEEMGDLLGMPHAEGGTTTFAPPEWVPRQEGPGILLIDDLNRADDRILRGTMQLLQNFELASWKLPPKWQMVCTANPDGGDYSVTPMDDAMLTRLLHVTLELDVKRWAKWADENGIDPRGIHFVLLYPETVSGLRTTPRTLVQFFERIAGIKDLRKNVNLVMALAKSCLDEETVTAFNAFLNANLEELVAPEEILGAKKWKPVQKRITELVDREVQRVDILSTICTRLAHRVAHEETALGDKEIENLGAFLRLACMPEDMRLALVQDLVAVPKPSVKRLFADPEIGRLMLRR